MNQNSTSARSWGTIVTHSDEMAIIYRYVDTFHDDWDLSSQPDRIIIAWRYEDETGMPAPNEREHLEDHHERPHAGTENLDADRGKQETIVP